MKFSKIKVWVGLAMLWVFGTTECAKAQVSRIPFELHGPHLYVQVKAGNSDSLRFVFDTGTTNVMIDSTTAERIGISKVNRQNVRVGGIAGASNQTMALDQNLTIGTVEVKHLNFVLNNFTSLSAILKTRLDGLIGYELINQYVTKVDFDKKELLLYDSINELDTAGYTGIPFGFYKNVLIPRFPITMTLINGTSFSGLAMFDTGNAFSLLVSAPYSQYHHLLDGRMGETFEAWGLNSGAADKVAAVKSLSFNGFELGKMTIRLTANDGVEAKDGSLGILGIEVIKHFNVILDYAHQKIYMKPNKSYQEAFKIETPAVDEHLNAESRAFLDKNKSLPGVKITGSGLQYKVLKTGTGARLAATDRVTLYYSLSLSDGKKIFKDFDAGNPWVHRIDKALAGMREALGMMPVGSEWELYLPSSLAFGMEGYEQVPAGAAIICRMTLVNAEK